MRRILAFLLVGAVACSDDAEANTPASPDVLFADTALGGDLNGNRGISARTALSGGATATPGSCMTGAPLLCWRRYCGTAERRRIRPIGSPDEPHRSACSDGVS